MRHSGNTAKAQHPGADAQAPPSKPLRYQPLRSRIWQLIFMGLFITMGSVWAIVVQPKIAILAYNPNAAAFTGYACFPIGAFFLLISLIRLLDPRPALEIDSDKVIYRMWPLLHSGRVLLRDVQYAKLHPPKEKSRRYDREDHEVLIYLVEPQKYLGPPITLMAWARRYDMHRYGTPININTFGCEGIDAAGLADAIERTRRQSHPE